MTTSDHAPSTYADTDPPLGTHVNPDPATVDTTKFTGLGEYAALAPRTAVYPGAGTGSLIAVAYAALGLANEAGEAAGKVKKVLRDHPDVVNFRDLPAEVKLAVADEVGDTLWYAALLCREIGVSLVTVARRNIRKLYSRLERGTLQGSGDNR